MKLAVKAIFLSLVLGASMFACAAQELQPLPTNIIYGTTPGEQVKSWIRFNIHGGSDHPLPVVWVSPSDFERSYPEILLVLSSDEYSSITKFIRSNICSKDERLFFERGTVEVDEYLSGNIEVRCIMPKAAACIYFSNLLKISDIAWTNTKITPFRRLLGEIGCLG